MTQSSARRHPAVLLARGALALPAPPAAAEVRFGPGVRIGGHSFSHRRYGSVQIECVKRLRGPSAADTSATASTGAATGPWYAGQWRNAI